MSVEALFQPFSVKSLNLPNRIVMAPMTRSFSPGGVPGEDVAGYYRRRAENDVGLILSEGTGIGRSGALNDPAVPHFHGDTPLAGWSRVLEGVHAAGGRMGPQIWHVGAVRARNTPWEPEGIESPSGLAAPDKPRGAAMTEEDIADTVAAFAAAAAEARRIGFDTLEIHGAHGYLIDQFFWGATNTRADAYGGATLKQRSRFAAEVIAAIRRAVGPDFPIILRISQWKGQDYGVKLAETPEALGDWLVPLVEAGVDVLHCSQRRFWEPEFPAIDGEEGLNFAGWARRMTAAPTISVGSVGLSGEFIGSLGGESSKPASLDGLIRRMERDEFDLIAVGRALLADPAWARKVRGGETDQLRDFTPAAFAELV